MLLQIMMLIIDLIGLFLLKPKLSNPEIVNTQQRLNF